MKIVEHDFCYTIEGVFGSSVIAGFTKPSVPGNIPEDINVALSFLPKSVAVAGLKQVHGAQIHAVESAGIWEGDGLITKAKDVAVVVRTADCLPVLFARDDGAVVGAVHMGWRSARAAILQEILPQVRVLGAENVPDLSRFTVFAGIGLRQCCYQVGGDFLTYPEFDGALFERDANHYFDVMRFFHDTLHAQGVKRENLFDLNQCSYCYKEHFFSCRRDNPGERTLSFILKH